MGLAYAISDRGACHLRTTFYKPELTGMIPPDQIEGKAKLFIEFEDRLTLFDTLILCRFFRDIYDWGILEQVVEAVTGIPSDKASLRQIASMVTDIVRRFNLREGLTLDDDDLPSWIYENILDGESNITKTELRRMRSDYYSLRAWSKEGNLLDK
jgi:aldehyde:ferredoxin oxidoreductase